MKNNTLFLKSVLIISICTMLFSFSKEHNKSLPEPTIIAGMAGISGKIKGYEKIKDKGTLESFYLTVYNPITGGYTRKDIEIKSDGTFSVKIPIEITPVISYLYFVPFNKSYFLCLSANENTEFEIVYDKEEKGKMNVKKGFNFISDDINHFGNVLMNMEMDGVVVSGKYIIMDSINRFIENPGNYASYIINRDLKERLEQAKKDTILSESGKTYLSDYYSIYTIESSLFNYPRMMHRLYNMIKMENDTVDIMPEWPDKSYYSFLKEINLNDPQHLYTQHYSDLFQSILSTEALKIPRIHETPIEEWLTGVKSTISDLVGIDRGLFYEVLVANAYSKQFIEEMRPLSRKQIENIKSYYKESELEKVLLRKNEEITIIAKNSGEIIINNTPDVPKEKLMDVIISKYKGKTIMVDFWATWCGPCLNAMKEFDKTKKLLKDKNITFVYITTTSSPENLWRRKIGSIDGEHYYLTEKEWDYIMHNFNIKGIPAYLIYDVDGKLTEKFVGYPGAEKLKEVLEK